MEKDRKSRKKEKIEEQKNGKNRKIEIKREISVEKQK